MINPLFSLCYTTVRAAAVPTVVTRWLERAANVANVELIISYDDGDNATRDAALAAQKKYPNIRFEVVANLGPKNCVSGWNTAAAQSKGDIIITIADDFDCLKNWDKALISINALGWWKHECVVWVKDGYNTDLFTLGILTRKRYDRFGYVFYPGYQSLFCDTEYTYLAAQDRIVIDARHLLFEHLHPDCGKRERDATDLKHASKERWAFGETLFNYRRSVGFPLDDGPAAARYATEPVRYAVVVQAIRDDLCLYEVCQRILEEGIKLEQTTEHHDRIERIFLFVPDMRWDGTPANEDEREDVRRIAERLETWLDRQDPKIPPSKLLVEYVPYRVRDVSDVTQERIKIETGCRNWYQRFCLEKGYQHCIILDGDELWREGLLTRMNELVRERWPMSVFTGMIPVAGLPAYPIEGALDKATIYARADARFDVCRGAFGYRHELLGFDIYHFSAVRRTLEEIAGKHLGSGHADDKDYAMADWVKDTLMTGRIRPGARDVHMFRKPFCQNVWPLVRRWTKEELASLPHEILKYMGQG